MKEPLAMKQLQILSQPITAGSRISGFIADRAEPVPELHSTAYLFTHEKTGARVIHLYNDDPDNLFCAAFRTPVSDNTGVPHILEHSVLGGSQSFPVKDPFQEMLKGSLQTFLNALTYRDKTIYPVASQVEKDFFNLVSVYCDAVFNPLLTENTFYQEGWHFDGDGKTPKLGIKGIVFNEMKGVFSDFASHVSRKTIAALMPDTAYAFESGGEPEHIVELTHEAFVSFHRRYYHPSNSYIFLYGNIPSDKTLSFIGSNYLEAFDRITPESDVQPQPLWGAPKSFSYEAPSSKEDDGTATVLLAWIVGKSADPFITLCGSVLSHYLLGTESSPLKRALIDSNLGEDLDDMSGFAVEAVQSVFCAGLRKTRAECTPAIETLILETLRNEVDKGMNSELLEGAVRQVEFHLREVSGGHFPYHLRLADRCYNSWLYGGDPLAHLAFEKPLERIKKECSKGDGFFRKFICTRILDNTHRLLATISASSRKGEEMQRQTEALSTRLTADFDSAERDRWVRLTAALVKEQNTHASPESLKCLPRIGKTDLPGKGFVTPFAASLIGTVPFYQQELFTSDIVYLDVGFDLRALRALSADLLPCLPLYLEMLRRCGTARYSYEQMATRIALSTGGIGASALSRTMAGGNNPGELSFTMFIHGKALASRNADMCEIMLDLLAGADLSNVKQLRDILLEQRNQLNAAIVNSGHTVAMALAASQLSVSRAIDEQLGGVSQLRFLDRLVKDDRTELLIPKLQKLHALVINRAVCFVSVTADDPERSRDDIASLVQALPYVAPLPETTVPVCPETVIDPLPRGIEISSAVNFAARAWRAGPFDPVEYGLLFLLARHLSTGYLWDKVRVEGGAYGGMAVMSVAHPVFACASYRDPNCTATLAHFTKGLQTVAAGVDAAALDVSIIGAIGRIDQPRPPHGRGFGECLDRLLGYTPEMRQKFREAVLGATPEQLSRVAGKLLATHESAIIVLGNNDTFTRAAQEGFAFQREQLL